LSNPEIKWHWDTTLGDNIIQDFYRPALKDAIFYQRKAGYFSSTAFVEISTEMINFIKRNGRMQLITSPNLSTFDKSIFEASVDDREKILSEIFLDDLANDPDGTKQHFAKLMAYMLTNEINGKPQLEIKIALTEDGRGLFHNKSGIIHQANEEIISFTGSNNETGSAWDVNDEEFVAVCSWNSEQDKQQAKQIQKGFENLWNENNTAVRLFDLPEAVKQKLLKISPKSTIEYQDTIKKVLEDIEKHNNDKDEESVSEKIPKEEEGLRPYQNEAIHNWMENNSRGIFSMATGTGKTFNAFGCINKILKKHSKIVIIIACPQTHLLEQWKKALTEFNHKMPSDTQVHVGDTVMCYHEKKWRPIFDQIVYDFNKKSFSGKDILSNFIVFVTHNTLNSNDFKEYIDKLTDSKILLVVDEMHNIGSELSLDALLGKYDYRLGLSATPMRHYDKEGSDALMKYFEKIVYDYPLKKAIDDGILCGYYYYPLYAELTSDEMAVYDDLTKKIAAKMNSREIKTDADDTNDPANRRAALVGNAENKLLVLEEILSKKKWSLKQTLIYCTSHPSPNLSKGSKTQLENVNDLISNHHLTVKSVTYEDPTKSRGEILDNLSIGHYDCITAVKCLDEGTDIPSVETAIIMASSGNPKQYIQRRGRVLRQSTETGKKHAVIYDILVKPPKYQDQSIQLRERKLLAKELLRHQEFAEIAINKDEAYLAIKEVKEYFEIPDKLNQDKINNL
jgi:superfamily II DNA or RNA helicase